MDGENNGKPLLKLMIWGYHYYWKHPYPFITLRSDSWRGCFCWFRCCFFRQGRKNHGGLKGSHLWVVEFAFGKGYAPEIQHTGNDGLDDVSPFMAILGIYIIFQRDTQKKLPCDQFPISEFCLHREKCQLVRFLTSMNFDHWLPKKKNLAIPSIRPCPCNSIWLDLSMKSQD